MNNGEQQSDQTGHLSGNLSLVHEALLWPDEVWRSFFDQSNSAALHSSIEADSTASGLTAGHSSMLLSPHPPVTKRHRRGRSANSPIRPAGIKKPGDVRSIRSVSTSGIPSHIRSTSGVSLDSLHPTSTHTVMTPVEVIKKVVVSKDGRVFRYRTTVKVPRTRRLEPVSLEFGPVDELLAKLNEVGDTSGTSLPSRYADLSQQRRLDVETLTAFSQNLRIPAFLEFMEKQLRDKLFLSVEGVLEALNLGKEPDEAQRRHLTRDLTDLIAAWDMEVQSFGTEHGMMLTDLEMGVALDRAS